MGKRNIGSRTGKVKMPAALAEAGRSHRQRAPDESPRDMRGAPARGCARPAGRPYPRAAQALAANDLTRLHFSVHLDAESTRPKACSPLVPSDLDAPPISGRFPLEAGGEIPDAQAPENPENRHRTTDKTSRPSPSRPSEDPSGHGRSEADARRNGEVQTLGYYF
jgi:hypothetical protein